LLDVTKALLELESKYEVDCVSTVDQAIDKLATDDYDAIISDYEMPNKDGLLFLKELRENKNEIPFVLFTGKGREEVAIKALNLGADGYINKQGNPETVYGELEHTLKNIIENHESRKKLTEVLLFSQKIIDSTPNLIYIYDLTEQKNVYSNKNVAEFLGYSPQQILAMDSKLLPNMLHPEDEEAVKAHHAQFAEASDNTVFEVEYRMRHSDGEWHWLHSNDVLFSRTAQGKSRQILGVCQDITKQKKANLELIEKFEQLDTVGENVDAGLAIIDRNYNILWSNRVLAKIGALPQTKYYKSIAKKGNICEDCGVKKVFEQNIPLDIREYISIDSKGKKNGLKSERLP
jgi:PAS domain S-box-containing protein